MTRGGRMTSLGSSFACALGLLLIVSTAAPVDAGMTGTWTVLQPSQNTDPSAPLPRVGHIMVVDSARNRLLLHGGTIFWWIDGDVRGDTQAFSMIDHTWTNFTTRHDPSRRNGHSLIPTAIPGEFLMFGGGDFYGERANDTWLLSVTDIPRWTEVSPTGETPAPRACHVAIYDSARNRMVVWGGYGDYQVMYSDLGRVPNEVWVLPLEPDASWARLAVEGEPPALRYNATAIYDPVRDRMLLIGGREFYEPTGAVWALDFSPRPRWERLETSGNVPVPYDYLDYTPYQWTKLWAFYDAGNDLALVYDGWKRVWVLFLEGNVEGVELETSGDPPVRPYETAAYDPSCRTLYASAYGVWSLTLSNPGIVPVRIRPGSPVPRVPARLQGAVPVAVLSTASFDARDIDPATIRLAGAPALLHGKAGYQVRTQDVDHDGRADLVVNVDGGALEYGEPGTSLFLDAGTSDGRPVWGRAAYESVPPARALADPAPGTTPAGPALNLAVERAVPLASRRGAEVAIRSGGPGPVRIALFDIQGRTLGTAELPEGSPGARTVRIETPARLASGVYFVRVHQGDRSAARRLIVF